LNEARPDLQLEFVVSEWARPVLEHNPRLTALIDTGFAGSNFTLRQYLSLIKNLRQRKYSAALVLDRSPLLALLPWLAGIKVRAGLDSRGRGFALNLRAQLEATDPLRHEAETYLFTIYAPKGYPRFTISNLNKEQSSIIGNRTVSNRQSSISEFYPGEEAQRSLEEKAGRLGLDLGRKIVVIHPGGGHNPDTVVLSKRWPAENFGEIARRLAENGTQLVIIGAKSDRELVEKVLETAGPSPLIFNAAEQFDIAESGALFERATLFVGNDTGLMHVAAASGTKVVAIFGPSSPVVYGPYTSKGRAVSPLKQVAPEGLPLAEYQALSAAQGGIGSVTVEQVWETILSLAE
jgi:lipopolysaccharide heptosyltransferase II